MDFTQTPPNLLQMNACLGFHVNSVLKLSTVELQTHKSLLTQLASVNWV